MSNAFVVIMGVGTVFIGLICIIVLCTVMSALYRAFAKQNKPAAAPASNVPAAAPTANAAIADRPAFIAAVSAVVAEELGTDVSGIRIHSVKRV